MIEALQQILGSNLLELVGTLVGVVYLIFEYQANKLVWVAGVVMPAIYIFVYYGAGLYADFAINVYYLLIAIYGFMAWTFGKKTAHGEQEELPISHVSRRQLGWCMAGFVAAFVLIGMVLCRFTNSTVPWTDSFTTALSIVGMWMLARKLAEQWLVWLVVDVVSSALYVYKGLYFTSALYALYAVIAVFGYFKWLRMMAHAAQVQPAVATETSI